MFLVPGTRSGFLLLTHPYLPHRTNATPSKLGPGLCETSENTQKAKFAEFLLGELRVNGVLGGSTSRLRPTCLLDRLQLRRSSVRLHSSLTGREARSREIPHRASRRTTFPCLALRAHAP